MENLTFGGYPLEVIFTDNDNVILKCKGATGTLSQIERFLNGKSSDTHYFGQLKMRRKQGGLVKIDCLKDTLEHIEETYNIINSEKEKHESRKRNRN